ncbi:MAG TPA: thioredoxin domain-containing protein, partial [Solirubrobacterales bacterium]|nr:thioredoxin domain-containing protein [Solirubrobacterales bacterium]
AVLAEAVERLRAGADSARGGFGGAPKFPPASALELLMARGERAIVERSLDAMLAGGIYDQLGGGFARYSVDAAWLVPHFEKMLYDNALLARAYLHGWQVFGHGRYRRVCEETLDWALREMRGPEGGFYSALDADSEGEEGRFYTWTPDEIRAALVESAGPAESAGPTNCIKFSPQQVENLMQFHGVTDQGNFEGRNILHLADGVDAPEPEGLAEMREALYEARTERVWPGLDDKRLTSWNALMIAALAEAGAVLSRDDYLDAARSCAEFVWGELRDGEGRLLRTYKDGRAHLGAYLEDHAFLLEALLTLYEAGLEVEWFERARELAGTMLDRFADPERGGFFSTADDHEALIARRKEIGDHPIPSGNSAAALGLLRLGALTGERSHNQAAEGVLRLFAAPAARRPEAFAHLLQAIDFALAPTKEVALVGEDLSDLAATVRTRFRPHLVLAGGAEGSETPNLLAHRTALGGEPTAYVCESFACKQPVTDPAALDALL